MKKETKARSYVGKQVFIGIDVHKKTYTVVARVEEEVVKKWTTVASPQSLSQQLLKYFAGAIIYSAYEAGFSGFVLHRELEGHGIEMLKGSIPLWRCV
jgi:transposase